MQSKSPVLNPARGSANGRHDEGAFYEREPNSSGLQQAHRTFTTQWEALKRRRFAGKLSMRASIAATPRDKMRDLRQHRQHRLHD